MTYDGPHAVTHLDRQVRSRVGRDRARDDLQTGGLQHVGQHLAQVCRSGADDHAVDQIVAPCLRGATAEHECACGGYQCALVDQHGCVRIERIRLDPRHQPRPDQGPAHHGPRGRDAVRRGCAPEQGRSADEHERHSDRRLFDHAEGNRHRQRRDHPAPSDERPQRSGQQDEQQTRLMCHQQPCGQRPRPPADSSEDHENPRCQRALHRQTRRCQQESDQRHQPPLRRRRSDLGLRPTRPCRERDAAGRRQPAQRSDPWRRPSHPFMVVGWAANVTTRVPSRTLAVSPMSCPIRMRRSGHEQRVADALADVVRNGGVATVNRRSAGLRRPPATKFQARRSLISEPESI